MESPAVKDLPKLDTQISQEIAKDHNLKKVEVTEKIVLPTAEDVKAEKTHQGLIEGMLIFEGIIYFHIKNWTIKNWFEIFFFAGVESFTPDKLKPAKTREPASGVDVMKTEMAHSASKEAVEKFDKNNMKHVETQEKNPLPDGEAIRLETEHNNFKAGIEGFDKDKLSKAETVEKNTLPTKEVIEEEKKA